MKKALHAPGIKPINSSPLIVQSPQNNKKNIYDKVKNTTNKVSNIIIILNIILFKTR